MPRAGRSSSRSWTARRRSSTPPTARRCRACRTSASREGWPLAKLALELRRLGAQGHVPRDPRDVDVDARTHRGVVRVRAAAGGDRRGRASTARRSGSMSAGTGYTLMHNWLNRGGLGHRAGRRRQRPHRRCARRRAEGARRRAAHVGRRAAHPRRRAARHRRAAGRAARRSARATRVLRRRSAPHAARPRRRAGAAAGVRLAHAVDQDARLGRQGAPADRRQPRPAGRARWRSRRR